MIELERNMEFFCRMWDEATHFERLELAEKWGMTYDEARSFRNSQKYKKPKRNKFPPDTSWEEQIEIIKNMDKLIAYHQYVPSEISVNLKVTQPIAISFTADWHLGMFGCDYDSFEKDMNVLQTEDGLYCMVGGDGYQNIIEPSKTGSSHNQTPIAVQKGFFVLTLKKLASKIIAVGTGNHNYWTTMAEGEDWDKELARRLRLVYTKHAGKVTLKVGKMFYPILRLHKGRFGSSFNLTHTCKQYQRLFFPESRVVVVEHQHTAALEQYRYNENECAAIRTGTYAVYDDYAQQNGFFGSHVANPTVVLFPNEDKLVGFKSLDDAVIYLRAVRVEV